MQKFDWIVSLIGSWCQLLPVIFHALVHVVWCSVVDEMYTLCLISYLRLPYRLLSSLGTLWLERVPKVLTVSLCWSSRVLTLVHNTVIVEPSCSKPCSQNVADMTKTMWSLQAMLDNLVVNRGKHELWHWISRDGTSNDVKVCDPLSKNIGGFTLITLYW